MSVCAHDPACPGHGLVHEVALRSGLEGMSRLPARRLTPPRAITESQARRKRRERAERKARGGSR